MTIEIFFGECQYSKSPLQNESEYLSYEEVNNDLYNEFVLFYEQLKPPKIPMSFLQACFMSCCDMAIYDPKYSFGSHIGFHKNENIMMPSLLLEKNYVTNKKTRKPLPITDEMIGKIGFFIEEIYHFKYIGFERLN